MTRLHRQPICVDSALMVPMATLATPPWLCLDGVPPCWVVLWLLPWALMDGPISGALAGAALGLVLDGLTLDGLTLVPALIGLGGWWGRIGRRASPVQRSFNLGLLALLGTGMLGLTLLLQLLIGAGGVLEPSQWAWGLHTLACQTLVTGVLAPMLVSLQLLFWRRRVPA